ncbi:MAG: ATP-binding cassette domain-containing protein, partial [Clostridiales bacterium]|nr:ATP-binding cassette domain-containing protein [Clostridiales bacterium]
MSVPIVFVDNSPRQCYNHSMPLLEFKNVDYAYPSGDDEFIQALYSASISVERGELVALVGCNGSGKSTLARLCNGLIVP